MKTTTLLNEIICRPYSVIVINDEQIPICIDIIMAYMMGLKIEYVFTEEQNQRFIDLYTTNTTLRSQSNNQSKLIIQRRINTSLKNSIMMEQMFIFLVIILILAFHHLFFLEPYFLMKFQH